MWFRGVKVQPLKMMESAEGLSVMLAGFIRKQGAHVAKCQGAGEAEIASRLREITRQAEALARRLDRAIEEMGDQKVSGDTVYDIKMRFLLLVLQAHNLVAQSMALCHEAPSITTPE